MAVSARRDLNDVLMSLPVEVHTPWNAARWLGDADFWGCLARAASNRQISQYRQTYLDSIQCRV